MDEARNDTSRQAARDYHEFPKPGKLEIRATKPLANGRDLSRAYSPGVAEACLEIKADPRTASRYTARGNLVAVVSNGTREEMERDVTAMHGYGLWATMQKDD